MDEKGERSPFMLSMRTVSLDRKARRASIFHFTPLFCVRTFSPKVICVGTWVGTCHLEGVLRCVCSGVCMTRTTSFCPGEFIQTSQYITDSLDYSIKTMGLCHHSRVGLNDGVAAVDRPRRAIDKRRALAAEEDGDIGDLLGLADTLHRYRREVGGEFGIDLGLSHLWVSVCGLLNLGGSPRQCVMYSTQMMRRHQPTQ